jgi:beta-lactamase class B GOB
LNAMKNSDFDLWVASHASQFDLHELRQPNDSYNPTIFGNKKLYFEYLNDLEKNYLEKLKEDDKK